MEEITNGSARILTALKEQILPSESLFLKHSKQPLLGSADVNRLKYDNDSGDSDHQISHLFILSSSVTSFATGSETSSQTILKTGY